MKADRSGYEIDTDPKVPAKRPPDRHHWLEAAIVVLLISLAVLLKWNGLLAP